MTKNKTACASCAREYTELRDMHFVMVALDIPPDDPNHHDCLNVVACCKDDTCIAVVYEWVAEFGLFARDATLDEYLVTAVGVSERIVLGLTDVTVPVKAR